MVGDVEEEKIEKKKIFFFLRQIIQFQMKGSILLDFSIGACNWLLNKHIRIKTHANSTVSLFFDHFAYTSELKFENIKLHKTKI